MAKRKPRIEDVGEFVPNARKHLAQDTGALVSRTIKLADLFPEPNWKRLIESGRSPLSVSHLAMLYESLLTAPKANGLFNVSEGDWVEAYVQGIQMARRFFGWAERIDQVQSAGQWMAAQFGETVGSIAHRKILDVLPYWAITEGRTTLKPFGTLSLRQAELSIWLPRLGWPEVDDALKTNIVPHHNGRGGWALVQVKGGTHFYLGKPTMTEEEAVEKARAESRRRLETAKKVVRRRKVGDEERISVDVRGGKNITADQLMDEFHLRAVQFGEWVPQGERQAWLNHLYEALADLALVLGWPRKWMGLGGIAVAIGARGEGPAIAHYEPALRVVNFTRMRGGGSLSHEWWHAADHRLANHQPGADETNPSLLRSVDLRARAGRGFAGDLLRAFGDLNQALTISKLMEQARRIEALPGGRRYWTKMEELGARSFEAFVQDRLDALGLESPYLVIGTFDSDHEDYLSCSPYPVGEERQELAVYFDRIQQLLRQRRPDRPGASVQGIGQAQGQLFETTLDEDWSA